MSSHNFQPPDDPEWNVDHLLCVAASMVAFALFVLGIVFFDYCFPNAL